MFLEKFVKKAFISFYEDDKKYKLLIEIVKNKKILLSEKKFLNDKKELKNIIKNVKEDYPTHFISTFLKTINQGIVPGCNKKEFLTREIDIENIKYICIKNKYSFYVSIYDLVKIKKEYNLDIDFIFSIFAPIDFYAKDKDNHMYILILSNQIVIIIYKNDIPIYADITHLQNEDIDENEDIDLLEDIDIEEEISEDIEEEAENIDLENPQRNIENTHKELHIKEIVKKSIKEYYENYSDDFLKKITLLDTVKTHYTLKQLIEDELFIETEIIKFDLLKTLNLIAKEEINV